MVLWIDIPQICLRRRRRRGNAACFKKLQRKSRPVAVFVPTYGSVSKPCTPSVHIKIAGKWMFIPLKCIYRYWPIPTWIGKSKGHGMATWSAQVTAERHPVGTWKSNTVQCWGHLAVESGLSFRVNTYSLSYQTAHVCTKVTKVLRRL